MKSSIRLFSLLLLTTIFFNLSAYAGWDEGVAAFKGKNYNEAVREFTEFTQKNPGSANGHYMLGLSLFKLNQKAKAETHLRKAYDLNPNDLSIKVALARIYVERGNYKASGLVLGDGNTLGNLKQGISAELGAGAGFKNEPAEAQYLYGTTALKLGKKDDALKALKRAAELAPNNKKYLKAYRAAQ